MNCIQISKEDGSTYPLYFTDTELDQIHQYVEYRNLETDFINKLHESYYQIDYWLRAEHLEAIPELMPWLIQNFRKYQSADSRYNATLEKVLTHFHNVAITPELFRDLEALCLTAIPGKKYLPLQLRRSHLICNISVPVPKDQNTGVLHVVT